MRKACLMLVALLVLGGCSQSEMKQLETGAVVGTFNGHPVEVSWKRDTSGRMTVDLKIPTALTTVATAAASAATGGLSDFAGEAIAALIAAMTGGYAVSQRSARRRAEQDADAGWLKFEQAETRARELAMQVPPPAR